MFADGVPLLFVRAVGSIGNATFGGRREREAAWHRPLASSPPSMTMPTRQYRTEVPGLPPRRSARRHTTETHRPMPPRQKAQSKSFRLAPLRLCVISGALGSREIGKRLTGLGEFAAHT